MGSFSRWRARCEGKLRSATADTLAVGRGRSHVVEILDVPDVGLCIKVVTRARSKGLNGLSRAQARSLLNALAENLGLKVVE